MRTQQEIVNAFEEAAVRLKHHGITIESNSHFLLKADGKTVGAAETVDGLTSFADVLDFAKGTANTADPYGV